jgi:hypothetical protein
LAFELLFIIIKLFYEKEISRCQEKTGPGRVARDQAGVRAKSKAAEDGAGVAAMEWARAATVFVQIAVRKPRISRELPVLICNARSVEPPWYASKYQGLLAFFRRVEWL